jgi:hypothetical protein
MTNNDTRQTLKTGFINNNTFIYNGTIASDYVSLVEGDTVIDTAIDYVTAPFVALKLNILETGFAVADYEDMLTDNNGKVRITLPTDQAIPNSGSWRISLCTNREAQRQSLSQALKPKADL